MLETGSITGVLVMPMYSLMSWSSWMSATGTGGPKFTCHSGADDKGVIAATRMRGDIEQLKSGLERSIASVSALSNAGMEMSAQELAVGAARTRLTLARTEMHTFDPARVTPVVQEGLATLAAVDKAGEASAAELRFRRRGLAASLGVILLVVVALGFKIRQIERR